YARLRKTIKGTVEKKNAEIAELKTLLAGHEEKIEELTIDLHICSKERDNIVAEKELDQVLATEIRNRHTEICLERKALKAENAKLKKRVQTLAQANRELTNENDAYFTLAEKQEAKIAELKEANKELYLNFYNYVHGKIKIYEAMEILAEQQEDLSPEFNEVLNDNLNNMYVKHTLEKDDG
ncbi:MAG: hypothetical protein GY928_18800, partial [Colwellia sp.]|nr:hypothetical protein [Colwellia sp.]